MPLEGSTELPDLGWGWRVTIVEGAHTGHTAGEGSQNVVLSFVHPVFNEEFTGLVDETILHAASCVRAAEVFPSPWEKFWSFTNDCVGKARDQWVYERPLPSSIVLPSSWPFLRMVDHALTHHHTTRSFWINTDTQKKTHSVEKVRAYVAVNSAPTPSPPWMKMWSAIRETVMYHNTDTNLTVASLAAVHALEACSVASEPPPGWITLYDAEVGHAVYVHEESGEISRVATIEQARAAAALLEDAHEVLAPWAKCFSAGQNDVCYRNLRTGAQVRSTGDVAKEDTLAGMKIPPPPWEKRVVAASSDNSDLCGSAVLAVGLVGYYWHPVLKRKAVTVADIRIVDAVAAAPDPGAGWISQWNNAQQRVQYTSEKLQTSVFSLAEVQSTTAVAEAPTISRWTAAWDENALKVYYYRADTRASAWTLEDAAIQDAFLAAPCAGPNWTKNWCSKTQSVSYIHSYRADVATSTSHATVLDAIAAAPAPTTPGWTRVWCTDCSAVRYELTGLDHIVDSIKEIQIFEALVTAPDVISTRPWSPQWCATRDMVVYVLSGPHGTSDSEVADTLQDVIISDAMASTPDPGAGWERRWCPARGHVRFVNILSLGDECVDSIAEVREVNELAVATQHIHWTTLWDKTTLTIYWVCQASGLRADTDALVRAEDIRQTIASAPSMPDGSRWQKAWDAHSHAVEYRHLDVAGFSVASVDLAAQWDAAAVAPTAWCKVWNACNQTVEYQHLDVAALTVSSIAATELWDNAAVAPPPWHTVWDSETGKVNYVNGVSGKRRSSIQRVLIANEISSAPDQPGFRKRWSSERCMVAYESEAHPDKLVWSIADAITLIGQLALDDAPDADPPWVKRWSAVREIVYYYHPVARVRALSMREVRQNDEVQAAQDFGDPWLRIWCGKKNCVQYRHTVSGEVTDGDGVWITIELEAADPVPDTVWASHWEVVWDTDVEGVVYRHTVDTVANTYFHSHAATSGTPLETVDDALRDDPNMWHTLHDSAVKHLAAVVNSLSVFDEPEKQRQCRSMQKRVGVISTLARHIEDMPGLLTSDAAVCHTLMHLIEILQSLFDVSHKAACRAILALRKMITAVLMRCGDMHDGAPGTLFDEPTSAASAVPPNFVPREGRGIPLGTSVPSIDALYALINAPLPSSGTTPGRVPRFKSKWAKSWNHRSNQVMYRRNWRSTCYQETSLRAASVIELACQAPCRLDVVTGVYSSGWLGDWTTAWCPIASALVLISPLGKVAATCDIAIAFVKRIRKLAMPPIWEPKYDARADRLHFWNSETHESVVGYSECQRVASMHAAPDPLDPEGWRKGWDQECGLVMYVHLDTNRRVYLVDETTAIVPTPPHWSNTAGAPRLVTIGNSTAEAKEVSDLFGRTMDSSRITKIERVENVFQHRAFENTVDALRAHGDFIERTMLRRLFHGTRCDGTSIDRIVRGHEAGFLPFKSGDRTGAIWGSGTYFALNAAYSSNYAACVPAKAERKLILADVVTGWYCQGTPETKTAPDIPGGGGRRFNSMVDNTYQPTIFVVQHSHQAYPAYVITYI